MPGQDRKRALNNPAEPIGACSKILLEQAASITKEQFATSPDIDNDLLGAIMAALEAAHAMSSQALNDDQVRGAEGHLAELRGALGGAAHDWVISQRIVAPTD